MKNIDFLKKQKWYFGNFYLDCSNLDDNSLNANIISIPYCEIEGKYYTIKEYPMDNIRLTTRIKTSEEMFETKKQIKFLFK